MKHKKKKKHIFLKVLALLILAGIIAAGVFTGIFIHKTPKIDANNIYSMLDQSSYIYDKNDEVIGIAHYLENRKIISSDEFPEYLPAAFIAIEDKTFYEHHGVNFKRMAGAVISKLTGKSDAISGTSTITQQLARNVFLSDTKSERTIKRKATEILYAFELEKKLTKDQILEAYLNSIYFGYGCYGINSAAHTYFDKEVKDLDLDECALLAALPQAPDSYALLSDEETDYTVKIRKGLYANKLCEERRDLVLSLMEEQGLITEDEAEAAKGGVEEIVNPPKNKESYKYTYFKDYLISQVSQDLQTELGISEEKAEDMIYTDGLHIYSTIDPEAQQVIIDEFKDDSNFPGTVRADVDPEAAMVITEVGTGHIVAMVGGREGSGENLFNRATSPRQPGSSIKPLAVYSAALQKSYEYAERGTPYPFVDYKIDSQGIRGWGEYITTKSLVRDEKVYVNGQQWPNNVTRSFSGNKTFRRAIQLSINTCAVKILYQVGIDYSMELLEKYGLSTVATDTSVPVNDANAAALALGAMTEGVTPLEMALAYGTFPSGGYRNKGIAYTKVTDSEGNVLLESKTEETKVLDEGVAWIMTDVLKSVVTNGLGRAASISGVQSGGKTGTTDSSYDIWFCGFVPKYSAALWIGTDKNVQMTADSSYAARLWGRIMDKVPDATEGEYKERPDNVVYEGGEYFTDGTQGSSYSSYTSQRSTETRRIETHNTESHSSDSGIWED